ncbi:MAG: hypothetical protein IKJ68_04820 [Clostridia bacterium]|nr:hypothetical protein [Clostridia bacterium]
MIIFYIVFLFICLYKIKFKFTTGFDDYLSVNKTSSIKGIFILIVFFSHFNSYVNYTHRVDKVFVALMGYVGQAMVAMFLFYSGYGVMESIKNKTDYVNTIPSRRILSCLLQFDIAVLIYAVIKLIYGHSFTIGRFLLSLIGWEALGNSNWYIFTILVLYFITYVAFKLFSNKNTAVISVFFAVVVYVLCFRIFNTKPVHWYDTILIYPLGMMYSCHKQKIELLLCKKKYAYYLMLLFAAIFTVLLTLFHKNYFVLLVLKNIAFTMAVVLFTMSVSFDNFVLRWCGNHLFEIFILQRIPMIILKNVGIMNDYIYLSFVICLAVTVILSILFKKYVVKATNKICQK